MLASPFAIIYDPESLSFFPQFWCLNGDGIKLLTNVYDLTNVCLLSMYYTALYLHLSIEQIICHRLSYFVKPISLWYLVNIYHTLFTCYTYICKYCRLAKIATVYMLWVLDPTCRCRHQHRVHAKRVLYMGLYQHTSVSSWP